MSVLTVTQLNKLLSYKVKSELKFKGAAVKGELSNFSIHYKSGHAFFSIKDSESSIRAVMFAGNAAKLKFAPEDGMNILAVGNIEVYERDGTCQIIVTELTLLNNSGAVYLQRQALKEQLKKMGVFDESIKKPIPLVPQKLAVVTSPTGAALQDILNIVERRYPLCTLEIYPALVQGESAAQSVAEAIKRADASGADTIIVARGGGSAEDLVPFDSKAVAMAVYECVTPVISAVGHETDTTLTDYAADKRAPTPSAAAELATPNIADSIKAVNLLKMRLDKAMDVHLNRQAQRLDSLEMRIRSLSPQVKLERDEKMLSAATEKLKLVMQNRLKLATLQLDSRVSQLNMLSPFNVLKRGYSLVEKNGSVVSESSELDIGDEVSIRFADGRAVARIDSTEVITEET